MIVTVTLNPSLDLTYAVAEDALGAVDVHRARESSVEASGKGVNVSRDLHAAGVATLALLPMAGPTGAHLASLLTEEGVDHIGIPTGGDARINTSLLLPGGRTTKVNGPGPTLSPGDLSRLHLELDGVLECLAEGEAARSASPEHQDGTDESDPWLVLAGSLPAGVGADDLGDLVRLARTHGIPVAVDASGPALVAALEAGADLLAPNDLELAELTDAPSLAGAAPAVVAEAARELAAEHGVAVLVSMGRAGAVYTDGTLVLHGDGPVLEPVNTAGAGDAFLAGWLAAPGTPSTRMTRALAWGRSACLAPTTVDPAPGTRGTTGIRVTDLSTPSHSTTTEEDHP